MNLLIVDDEILAIQFLVDDMEWKKLDFDEVFTANSYAQAVNIMNKQEIDVLLCDIEMPLRSGVELVRWAKERNPELECIFLTCHAEFSFAKQAIQMGCLDYILKPAETEEVEECLRKAVKKIRKTREPASVKREKTEPSVSWTAEKIIGDSPKTKDAVELAEFYIIQHLTENLSLEEVAAEACVSPTHLTRLFKKRYQMGVVDFVTEKKMALAEELMKQENLTVSYIASKLGYSNYSYFTKVFKKYTGKTPTEYKKELAKS